MPFDPTKPANGSPNSSAEMRAQLIALKALIDALVPIGTVVAWDKNQPGVPPLLGTWVECNGQAVNDPESPLNGTNVRDLNGAQGGVPVFLRGATTSGSLGGAENHSHGLPLNINGGSVQLGTDMAAFPPGNYTSDPASSFPPYCEVVMIIKIK